MNWYLLGTQMLHLNGHHGSIVLPNRGKYFTRSGISLMTLRCKSHMLCSTSCQFLLWSNSSSFTWFSGHILWKPMRAGCTSISFEHFIATKVMVVLVKKCLQPGKMKEVFYCYRFDNKIYKWASQKRKKGGFENQLLWWKYFCWYQFSQFLTTSSNSQ